MADRLGLLLKHRRGRISQKDRRNVGALDYVSGVFVNDKFGTIPGTFAVEHHSTGFDSNAPAGYGD